MKKSKLTALVCALALMCTQTVFAAELGAAAIYDLNSEKLTVSGTGESNSEVTAIVLPYDFDETALSTNDVENGKAIFYMANTDSNGSFSFSLGIRNDWQAGMYKVVINQNGSQTKPQFNYAVAGSLAAMVYTANNGSISEINAALKTNSAAIGVSQDDVTKHGALVAKYISQNKPSGGYDADSFIKTFTAALAVSRVQTGEILLADAVSQFAAYMDIDGDEYNNCIAAEKSELQRLFKKTSVDGLNAKKLYDICLTLAKINAAESDVALSNFVTANYTELGIDLTTYNSLSSDYIRLNVFSTLMEKGGFDTYSAFATAFNTACQSALNGNIAPGGGGSGFGGGSGGTYTNTTDTSATASVVLSDIAGHWGEGVIRDMVAKGIVNGYPEGVFKPDYKVTRAEFSKMICTAFGYGQADYTNKFADVKANDWYAPFVLSLSDKGIITGYNGLFNADSYITRQDAAVILYRVLKDKGVSLDKAAQFSDMQSVSDYAKQPVSYLAGIKVVNGSDGKFAPLSNATRAEAVTMISNAINKIN